MSHTDARPEDLPPRRVLLIDDDETFLGVLARALARRGFEVQLATSVPVALALARTQAPDCAVVDLRLENESGLLAVAGLREIHASMRILVLTGYASIATTVDAMRLGAVNYLAKPADAAQIVAALWPSEPDLSRSVPAEPMSAHRMEWEHLQRVLNEYGGNISLAARALKMHRRTLQRKLSKRPSPDVVSHPAVQVAAGPRRQQELD